MDSISSSVIYAIVNRLNNHRYIGSAKNFNHRKKGHLLALERGVHHSIYLQRAWNKYGCDNFDFIIIKNCKLNELIKFEQEAIDFYKPEYNISPKAGSQLGYKHTEESKKKMSDKAKGRIFTEEVKKKIRDALIGRKRPKEVGIKISKTNKGRFVNEEWKKKLSISHLGKKHTDEQKRKIANAHIGRKNTKETIEKMRASALKRINAKKSETLLDIHQNDKGDS